MLDTIEIQDVRVLSKEVFQRLQAPYREKLALEALVAENGVTQGARALDAERRRVEEQSRRELMAEEEARFAVERRRAEEARQHEDALAGQRLEAELARQRRKAEADRERAAIELEAKREAGETDAALAPSRARRRTGISARLGSARCCSRRRCPRWRAPSAGRSIAST